MRSLRRNHPISRRAVLASAIPAVTSLAGCAGALDGRIVGSTRDSAVELPDGFSSDGIDTDAAFGPSSAMATASSLSLLARRQIEFSFGTLDHVKTGFFAREPDTFYTESKAVDRLTNEITVTERFYRDPALVERRKVEPGALGFRVNRSRHEMDPFREYDLDVVHSLASDVSFSSPTVKLIETGHPDHREEARADLSVASYSAETADFVPESLFERAGTVLGEFVVGWVEFEVDAVGYVHRFAAGGEYETTDGNLTETSFEWDYFDFDSTTVSQPGWIGEIPDVPAPVVDVEFDEVIGEEVRVHIHSMEHTEHVGVGVAGVGVAGELTEPGTVVVPADWYLLDDGEVATIAVIAEDAIDGPIPVAAHRPSQPDDQ